MKRANWCSRYFVTYNFIWKFINFLFYFKVDLLKDQVEEVEEQAALVLKELRAKTHDYELLKRDHAESVRAVQLLQQALTEQQAMLQERGLVLMGEDESEDAECDEVGQERRTRAIVSQETANILAGLGM